jgi:hypothetical protein
MRSGGGDTASVSLAATSVCGDTLEPFVLAATQEAEAPRRVLNSRIMTQLFFVVVLLALYLWLRVKARRYQKRKG